MEKTVQHERKEVLEVNTENTACLDFVYHNTYTTKVQPFVLFFTAFKQSCSGLLLKMLFLFLEDKGTYCKAEINFRQQSPIN